MKKRLFNAFIAVCLIFVSSCAWAAFTPGTYVGEGRGYSETSLVKVKVTVDAEKITAVAQEFQQQLRARSGAMQTGAVSTSIGIAFDAQGTMPIDSLFKHSDEALYEVKKRGKGSYFIWEPPGKSE